MNKNLAFLALTGVLTLASCGQNSDTTVTPPTCTTGQTLVAGVCVTPAATTGVLNLVADSSYTSVVKDASGNTVPATSYATLTPGAYTVTFSKTGYTSQTTSFNIVAGNTTTVQAPVLSGVPTTGTTSTTYYYVDSTGAKQPIPAADIQNAGSKFVLIAWLQNNNANAATTVTTSSTILSDSAAGNLVKTETAPIGNQNLAAAYVGYKAADGNTYPVVGAGVRWNVVQDASQTNVRFAASDDGLNAPNAVAQSVAKKQYISSNALQADTFTNAASNTAGNANFPTSTNYPLTNNVHLTSPNVDGATWTALWVPDGKAGSADISVVASIGGTEIDKTVLHKNFAASAHLVIAKSAQDASGKNITNPTLAPNTNQHFSITVLNDGKGAATGISLADTLSQKSNTAATYAINNLSSGTVNSDTTGFTNTFDLQPGESKTFTFNAQGSASGNFCDTAHIASYTNNTFGAVAVPDTDLSASACMTVQEPKLTILKEVVDANGNALSNQSPTVAAGTQQYVKVTLKNAGDAAATGVQVGDVLNPASAQAAAAYPAPLNTFLVVPGNGSAANYTVGTITASTGAGAAVPNAALGGFTTAPGATFDIPAGSTVSYLVPVTPTADGKYCDTAGFTSTNAGQGASQVCITVATPKLAISKVNYTTLANAAAGVSPDVAPGGTYMSTINVSNTGNADAVTVNLNDLVGNNGTTYLSGNTGGTYGIYNANNVQVASGSVNYSGNNFSLPNTVTIPAGDKLSLTVATTVPAGTLAGRYCDTATYTSDNAGTGNAQACVNVTELLTTHVQSGDSVDPLKADGVSTSRITFTSFNERTSNTNAVNHSWQINYGTVDPTNYAGAAGVFTYKNVHVIYDAAPVYDSVTGIITSDYTHGADITSDPGVSITGGNGTTGSTATGTGLLKITATNDMAPGSVMYIIADVSATNANPDGYNSVVSWNTTNHAATFHKPNVAAENTTTIK